jgi:hypothetical protein
MSNTSPVAEPSGAALLGRRGFLGSAGLAVGAVLASAVVPLSFASPPASAAAVSAGDSNGHGTGHVDDACGHWPPYSHPIPYGHAPTASSTWANLDPIDHIFMI